MQPGLPYPPFESAVPGPTVATVPGNMQPNVPHGLDGGAQFAYGMQPGAYAMQMGGAPGYITLPNAFAGLGLEEEVRTLFLTGFINDVKNRELNNLLRFLAGYEASQMNWRTGQPQGFALFATAAHARGAMQALNGIVFDDNSVLHVEFARRNMILKDNKTVMRPTQVPLVPMMAGGGPAGHQALVDAGLMAPHMMSPMVRAGGGGGLPLPSMGLASMGMPMAAASGTNSGAPAENGPCNTLFIGNLGDNVDENEILSVFSIQKGFKQMKLVRRPKMTVAFAEFDDVQCAASARDQLHGAFLGSSDRGGIRIEFSKNPLGKRIPN